MELKECEVIEKVERLTYSQDWPNYNKAKTQEKTIAQIMLVELAELFDAIEKRPNRSRGRPPLSLRDKLVSMFIYTYNKASSRKSIPDIEIAKKAGILEQVPHFNSILNMFKDYQMNKILTELVEISAMPLKAFENHFSVDSSGFSCHFFQRWFDIRTQKESIKQEWNKVHIVSGAKTNIITALLVSEGTSGDCPELIPLVERTAKYFEVKEVSADKAYLSRGNLKAIASIGAIPYIPFKSNSKQNPRGCKIWSTMFGFFYGNQDKFMERYHLRSNVETVFSMIKRTFGYKLRTKRFGSQINEILMKCLCHNLTVLVQESFELGLDINLKKCLEDYFAQKINETAQK